jgi:hypothetical protein
MSGPTADELARQAGTTPEHLERFVELGIHERVEGRRPFGPRDMHRVRLAKAVALFRALIRDSSPAG